MNPKLPVLLIETAQVNYLNGINLWVLGGRSECKHGKIKVFAIWELNHFLKWQSCSIYTSMPVEATPYFNISEQSNSLAFIAPVSERQKCFVSVSVCAGLLVFLYVILSKKKVTLFFQCFHEEGWSRECCSVWSLKAGVVLWLPLCVWWQKLLTVWSERRGERG